MLVLVLVLLPHPHLLPADVELEGAPPVPAAVDLLAILRTIHRDVTSNVTTVSNPLPGG